MHTHSVRFSEPENEPKQIFLTEIFLKDPIEIDLDQINEDKIALAKQHQSSLHSNGNSDREKVLETSFRVEKYFFSPKLVKQHSIDEDEPPDLELVDPESMAVIPHVATSSNQISISASGNMDKKETEPETICVDKKEAESEQETQFNENTITNIVEAVKSSNKSVSNCDNIDEGLEQGASTDKKCQTTVGDQEVVNKHMNGTCENESIIKSVSEDEGHLFNMAIQEDLAAISEVALTDFSTEPLPAATVLSTNVSTNISTAADVSAEISTDVLVTGLTVDSTAGSIDVSVDVSTADSKVVHQESFDKSIQSQSISKDSSFEYDEIKRADNEKHQVEASGQSPAVTASTTTTTAATTTTTPPHRFATIKKNIESASTVKESSMGQISRTYKKCKK